MGVSAAFLGPSVPPREPCRQLLYSRTRRSPRPRFASGATAPSPIAARSTPFSHPDPTPLTLPDSRNPRVPRRGQAGPVSVRPRSRSALERPERRSRVKSGHPNQAYDRVGPRVPAGPPSAGVTGGPFPRPPRTTGGKRVRPQGQGGDRDRGQWRDRARDGAGPGQARARRSPSSAATPRSRAGGEQGSPTRRGRGARRHRRPARRPTRSNGSPPRSRDRFGRIDILFNNAGINIRKPPHELTARGVAYGARRQSDQRASCCRRPSIRR